MQRLLYTSLYYLLTPLFFLRLLVKHRKSSAYKAERQSLRLAERLGFFAEPGYKTAPIWIHTVSVGEFLAALPLLRRLMDEIPQHPLVLTCTTTTGSALIVKTFAEEIKQKQVFHVYLPYDLPGSMKRFLQKIQPCLGLVMETEIWPNLLTAANRSGVPVWLLNARMSARSAKGYARFTNLTQSTLQKFTGIAAQDVLDAERLKALGANDNTLCITGSIKFDLQLEVQDIQAGKVFREKLHWQDKTVLIAASTHKGEDEILLDIYQQLKTEFPNLVMIVVPRHPERFQSVYQLLCSANSTVLKRTQMNEQIQSPVDILLGDSMGEMIRYFSCADLVFMGGTLVPTGGHNILEPAALGLPILYGPHIFNFHAINELFLQYEASRQVADKESLQQALHGFLADKKSAEVMGERARQLMAQNSGALTKMMKLLRPYF